MSTSTTILGLAGAFGAGSVITTTLKSQLDRVEKFRDRQIEAATEFLRLANSVASRLSALRPAGPDRDGQLSAVRERIDDLTELGFQAYVIFNKRSVTGWLMRWRSVHDAVRTSQGTLRAWWHAEANGRESASQAAAAGVAHQELPKAFNRAIRRRWRV